MNRGTPAAIGQVCYTPKRGYVALITVLVVGAIAVAITISQLLLGTDALRNASTREQSDEAAILARACAEEGLQQVRNSTSYTGSGNLGIDAGTCSYVVTSQGENGRVIQATGTVGSATRKTEVIVRAVNPTIQVDAWQDVSDF